MRDTEIHETAAVSEIGIREVNEGISLPTRTLHIFSSLGIYVSAHVNRDETFWRHSCPRKDDVLEAAFLLR